MFAPTTKPVNDFQCFVLMPFDKNYEEIYQDIIKPLMQEMGFTCLRADEIYTPTPIMNDVWESIQTSGVIIADLTSRNPNVFYELGLAHAIGKDAIIISQSMDDVPFDLRHLRCIVYEHSLRGLRKLADSIRKNVMSTPAFRRLPMEYLTDDFYDTMPFERASFRLELAGQRGSKSQVTETFTLRPDGHGRPEHYKKVQVVGRIADPTITVGDIEVRTLFPGLYLLWSRFSPPLNTDTQPREFGIGYRLLDSFPEDREEWLYNIESQVDHFEFRLAVAAPLKIEPTQFFLRLPDDHEVDCTYTQEEDAENGQIVYSWAADNLESRSCLVVRWKWAYDR